MIYWSWYLLWMSSTMTECNITQYKFLHKRIRWIIHGLIRKQLNTRFGWNAWSTLQLSSTNNLAFYKLLIKLVKIRVRTIDFCKNLKYSESFHSKALWKIVDAFSYVAHNIVQKDFDIQTASHIVTEYNKNIYQRLTTPKPLHYTQSM